MLRQKDDGKFVSTCDRCEKPPICIADRGDTWAVSCYDCALGADEVTCFADDHDEDECPFEQTKDGVK